MWRDDATLLDILRAARLALEFRGKIDKTSFLSDLKTQTAVLHELDLVWKTVDEDLPPLVDRLKSLAPGPEW